METQNLDKIIDDDIFGGVDETDERNVAVCKKEDLPVPADDCSYMEIPTSEFNFNGSTEEQLFQHIKSLNTGLQMMAVTTYLFIGKNINSFYKKKYGKNELQRIADATGIGKDTLTKACKFAKNYSQEQIEILLSGSFQIPWNHIANNLSVPADRLIETYQKSDNIDEFHNGIIQLKNPDETRGRNRGTSRSAPRNLSASTTPETIIQIAEPTSDETEVEDIIDTLAMNSDEGGRSIFGEAIDNRIPVLEKEIVKLKEIIKEKEQQVNSIKNELTEKDRILDEKEEAIFSLQEHIATIREGLEDGVTVNSIIDWMDNGE